MPITRLSLFIACDSAEMFRSLLVRKEKSASYIVVHHRVGACCLCAWCVQHGAQPSNAPLFTSGVPMKELEPRHQCFSQLEEQRIFFILCPVLLVTGVLGSARAMRAQSGLTASDMSGQHTSNRPSSIFPSHHHPCCGDHLTSFGPMVFLVVYSRTPSSLWGECRTRTPLSSAARP